MADSMIVAEKIGNDVSSLSEYEKYFAEGDTGELRVYLDRTLYQDEIEQLEQEIQSQGVIAFVTQDARMLIIKFRKALAPLVIIAAAVAAISAAGAGVVGWQIFKTTKMGVPLWAWIVGGAALAYLLLREPVKKAAPYAIHAGKVYVGGRYGKKWLKD